MTKIAVDNIDTCLERGETICVRLKEHYHPNEPWTVAYRPVAEKFMVIKEVMRRIMPYTTDDALLDHLLTYAPQDLAEVYDRRHEEPCGDTQGRATPAQ